MKIKNLFPLLLITSLTSCSQNPKVLENKIFCFDTMVHVELYDGTSTDLDFIEGIFKKYDALTDNYHQRDINNVFTINNTNEDVKVDNKLYKLLETSFDVKNHGGTYFNPLCGSLAKKWKNALKNQQILDENTINEEILKINNTTVSFLEDNVIQRNGEAEIDLGGIAKGYALDEVKTYLNNGDIKHYLINAGSSSILLGEKNSKDGFYNVGIKDIKNAYLKLKNCFISTSSKSVQGVTIDGTTYSHIINPITGSAINENDAVLVISDSGYYGDAMSTSLMMNTVDEIKEIEKDNNIKTIVIKGGKIIYHHEEVEVLYH